MISDEIKSRIAIAVLISEDEYKTMSLNHWERIAILPLLEDEALIMNVEYCLQNCVSNAAQNDSVYEGALVKHLVPELIRRLRSVATEQNFRKGKWKR